MLRLFGIPFEVVSPAVTELELGDPAEIVVENAQLKAAAGADVSGPESVVIGCDTDVVLDDRILGKPEDPESARERLRALSGRSHLVLSGLCLQHGERRLSGLAETTVTFRRLPEPEIETYVATGEWEDRAGGYAVQGFGSSLVASIEGDLSNVIGLPVPLLADLLAELAVGETG